MWFCTGIYCSWFICSNLSTLGNMHHMRLTSLQTRLHQPSPMVCCDQGRFVAHLKKTESARPPKFAVLECNKRRSKRRVCAYGVCSKEQRIYFSQWSRLPSIDLNLRSFWKAFLFRSVDFGWWLKHQRSPLHNHLQNHIHRNFGS